MDGGERIEITVLGGLGGDPAAEWDACAAPRAAAPAARPLHHPPLPEGAGGLALGRPAAPAGRRATWSRAWAGRSSRSCRSTPRATARASTSSTTTGRMPGSAPAAATTRSSRRRCRSRPPPAAASSPARATRRRAAPRCCRARWRWPDQARVVEPARHLLHRGGARLGREPGPARPHHPAVPLAEPRLRRLRRLPRRPRLAQAQGDPQGARARARLRRRDRGADRRRAATRALGRLLALLPGHRRPQVGPTPTSPAPSSTACRPPCATTCCWCSPAAAAAGWPGALNFIGRDTLYGRYWGCVEDHRLPALRALLLPGDRLGHRPRPRPRRGRRPGRAQAGARLPAGRHPLAALDRRRRLRPRRRAVPRRRGPRRRPGDRGAHRLRPVPPLRRRERVADGRRRRSACAEAGPDSRKSPKN